MVSLKTTSVSLNGTIGAGLCALGLLAFASSAYAQNAATVYTMDAPKYQVPGGLTAQAAATETGYYDSNPLLLTTGERSLWGSITSPEFIIGDKTPETTVASDTIFTRNTFNQTNFDSNDVHSKLNLAQQNDKWATSFLGNVDYDTTRTSELSVYNNLHTTPVRHLGESLNPQIAYSFLPTDKLSLLGNYSEAQYGNTVFTDYHSYSISPTYSHSFDERNLGFISLEAQRYQALDNGENINDTVGPSIGWQKTFTEQLSGKASVGFQETRQKTVTTPNPAWTAQYNYAGSLNFRGDQDLISANASRSEYPFGNGTEALLTQLTLSETHALNPLFSLGAQGSYEFASYQASSAGSLQSLASGTGNVTYHMTDQVDLTATYEYEYETLIGNSNSAQKNIGLLSISYHPTPWTL